MNKKITLKSRKYLLLCLNLLRDKLVEFALLFLKSRESRFGLIYFTGYWRNLGEGRSASYSGVGSSIESTESLRNSLPQVLRKLRVCSILDIPCGDFHWMSKVDLGGVQYIGADIVEALIENNRIKWQESNRHFIKRDITIDPLPKVDLIFTRDCLVHLSDAQIFLAFQNIVDSGAKYFASTTFPNTHENRQSVLVDGWRPVNLTAKPFCLPKPIEMIDDSSMKRVEDVQKAIGIWRVEELRTHFLDYKL